MFPKNRNRLLAGDIAAKFLAAVLAHPRVKLLLSRDRFSVGGTLIEAWTPVKSVKPKDGSGEPPAEGGRRKQRRGHPQSQTGQLLNSLPVPARRPRRVARRSACGPARFDYSRAHGLAQLQAAILGQPCHRRLAIGCESSPPGTPTNIMIRTDEEKNQIVVITLSIHYATTTLA